MLLTIHNLPATTRYSDVKSLVQSRCGLSEVLLDNLVSEGQCKKVTLGVAEEEDAAIVVRQINGLYVNGQQLYVEKVRQKKTTEQPYRASDPVQNPNYPNNRPGGDQPNVPVAANMAYNQMGYGYNPQATQDPMMQMMMAQQMMSGMYMMPQQQTGYMGNSSQTPAQMPSLLSQPSQAQYNYQDQNADLASNNYTNSKKDTRSQNTRKSSQNANRGGAGDQNRGEQGYNRGNPYQQSSNFKIDRRSQASDNRNEDLSRRNVSNDRNKPYQGQSFNPRDDRRSPIYDYQDQRQFESDRNQPNVNKTSTWSRGQPENYQGARASRNRSRSPRGRNTYNTSPQTHGRETYGSRDDGNYRYDQAPQGDYYQENFSGRNPPTDRRREVPAHQTVLETARQYYDSANQSSSQNNSYSANRGQPPAPQKRSYNDSAAQSSSGGYKTFANLQNDPPQRDPPNAKRQKIVPPSGRNALPQGGAPSSGIPSLMSLAPSKGIAPSGGRNAPLLSNPSRGNAPQAKNQPPRANVPQTKNQPPRANVPQTRNEPPRMNAQQTRNEPEKRKRTRPSKPDTYQARLRRSESFRQQAGAHIGKAIFEKYKPENPMPPEKVVKMLKGIKLAVHNRIELLLANELEVPIEQIIERYRSQFPRFEDDQKLYSAVLKNVEEAMAKEEQDKATKSDSAGPAPVNKQSSEAVVKNEMPAPKQETPVPKQEKPAPKQAMPAPKQAVPAPKKATPVPKQSVSQQFRGPPASVSQYNCLQIYIKPNKKGKQQPQKKNKKDVFILDPFAKNAIEQELEALNKVFITACKGAKERDEQTFTKFIASKLSRLYLTNVRLNLLKRLEDDLTTLEVRISLFGKVPPQGEIYNCLRPFGITGLWREKMICGRPYYLARFQDRDKFEHLCAMLTITLNPHTILMFKPKTVIRGGKRNPLTAKGKKNKKKNAKFLKGGRPDDDDESDEDLDDFEFSDGDGDEGENFDDGKDEEVFYEDFTDVKPIKGENLDDGKGEDVFYEDITEVKPIKAEEKPQQQPGEDNDVKVVKNDDDTNVGGANEDDAKECFMVGGEEYQVEDEVCDVKDEDLEDW